MPNELIMLAVISILSILLSVSLFVIYKLIKLQDSKERKYINAVLSKDLTDYTLAETKQRVAESDETDIDEGPSYIPETELSDDKWFSSINSSVEKSRSS